MLSLVGFYAVIVLRFGVVVVATSYDAYDDDVDGVVTLANATPTLRCPDRCVCSAVVVNCMFLNVTDLAMLSAINRSVEIL